MNNGIPGVDARAVDFCVWLDEWNAKHDYPPAIGDAFDAAYRIAWTRAMTTPHANVSPASRSAEAE